jgi:hypothetical protein
MKENSQKSSGKVFLKFENGHLFLSIFRLPKTSLLTKNFITIFKIYRHNLNDKIYFCYDNFLFFKGLKNFSMDDLDDQIEQKTSLNFSCLCCDYSTCKKTNYNRHILTDKHQRMTKTSKMSKMSKM